MKGDSFRFRQTKLSKEPSWNLKMMGFSTSGSPIPFGARLQVNHPFSFGGLHNLQELFRDFLMKFSGHSFQSCWRIS